MTTTEQDAVGEIRKRLVELAGRTTQELGMGRITGQVMGHVFLKEEDCSLDEIAAELGLSKAAVSIAARQLESLRLIEKSWKKGGDRKHYYHTARHFGVALQQGGLRVVRDRISVIGAELDRAEETLAGIKNGKDKSVDFLRSRIERGRRLRKRALQLLDSPILKLIELTGTW